MTRRLILATALLLTWDARAEGPRIKVTTTEGETFSARLSSASETELKLDVGGAPVTLPLAKIRKIDFGAAKRSVGASEPLLGPSTSSPTPGPSLAPAPTRTGAQTTVARCQALTKKGKCPGIAEPGRIYCWQH